MDSELFRRLNDIDRLPGAYSEAVQEAYEIMERFAKGPNELSILIDEWGGSVTPGIANPLAFIIARKAESPSQEMAELVLRFIGRFRCWDHPSTIMNCLTAVQHCLHYVNPLAGEVLRSLSPFLRTCLDYSGNHWVIIKGHSLALLPVIWERDLVNKIFTDDEVVWLRDKVHELRITAAEELRQELLDVQDLIQD